MKASYDLIDNCHLKHTAQYLLYYPNYFSSYKTADWLSIIFLLWGSLFVTKTSNQESWKVRNYLDKALFYSYNTFLSQCTNKERVDTRVNFSLVMLGWIIPLITNWTKGKRDSDDVGYRDLTQ